MFKLLVGGHLILLFCSCRYQSSQNNADSMGNVTQDSTIYQRLRGTWIRHNKEGFALIEVMDTSSVLYYHFIDRNINDSSISSDRYWYYKSAAKMGYWNKPGIPFKASSDIWIATDRFRFDYTLKGDTLIEIDKMGKQKNFIKVEAEKPMEIL